MEDGSVRGWVPPESRRPDFKLTHYPDIGPRTGRGVSKIEWNRYPPEGTRYAFYERSKVYLAAPPDVIAVDEKHVREYPVTNCVGVVFTTNHPHVDTSRAGTMTDRVRRKVWIAIPAKAAFGGQADTRSIRLFVALGQRLAGLTESMLFGRP